MRVMFMGTPEIAVRCFQALLERHTVCCVVTKQDKPKGRGKQLSSSAVKEEAASLGIDIVQPKTLKDGSFLPVLERYRPDVIVVVAFGLILPKYVLDYPRYGCINVHASLLPKYRGAAPIQWSIANGETMGGITTMLMNEGLDTGDILLESRVEITPEMTGGELHDAYCSLSSQLVIRTLDALEKNTLTPRPQNHGAHTYAPILTNENTHIDWAQDAKRIVDLVRAMNPYPVAYTHLGGKKLKVYRCVKGGKTGVPGTVLSAGAGIEVACADGSVIITELQLEGKRRMGAKDFLLGHKITPGEVLG